MVDMERTKFSLADLNKVMRVPIPGNVTIKHFVAKPHGPPRLTRDFHTFDITHGFVPRGRLRHGYRKPLSTQETDARMWRIHDHTDEIIGKVRAFGGAKDVLRYAAAIYPSAVSVSKRGMDGAGYEHRQPSYTKLSLLSEAQNWRCCYCVCQMELPTTDVARPFTASIEHLHKRADGGNNEFTNLVAACTACNSTRQDFEPEEFYDLRQQLIEEGWEPGTWTPFTLRVVDVYDHPEEEFREVVANFEEEHQAAVA